MDATPDELVDLLSRLAGAKRAPEQPRVPAQPVRGGIMAALDGAGADAHADTSAQARQFVKNVLHEDLAHMLADVSWRIDQARQLEGAAGAAPGSSGRQVFAEDLSLRQHILTGYTVTANTPAAGSIAWADLHIVYNGTDNAITDGNTANRYVYWDPTTPTQLKSSATRPTIPAGGTLVFVNDNGTPIEALTGGMAPAVAPGAVDSAAILAGAVGSTQLANNAVTAGKILDGAVAGTKIATDAVDSSKIASGAVGNTELGTNAVSDTKIQTGAVTNAKIGGGAVDDTKLATGAVTGTKLADGAVSGTKIVDGAVTDTKIGTGAVTTGKITDGAVTTTKLGAGAITAPKLSLLQHVLY